MPSALGFRRDRIAENRLVFLSNQNRKRIEARRARNASLARGFNL